MPALRPLGAAATVPVSGCSGPVAHAASSRGVERYPVITESVITWCLLTKGTIHLKNSLADTISDEIMGLSSI